MKLRILLCSIAFVAGMVVMGLAVLVSPTLDRALVLRDCRPDGAYCLRVERVTALLRETCMLCVHRAGSESYGAYHPLPRYACFEPLPPTDDGTPRAPVVWGEDTVRLVNPIGVEVSLPHRAYEGGR